MTHRNVYLSLVATFLLILRISCFGQEPASSGQNRKPLTGKEIKSFFGVTTNPFTPTSDASA